MDWSKRGQGSEHGKVCKFEGFIEVIVPGWGVSCIGNEKPEDRGTGFVIGWPASKGNVLGSGSSVFALRTSLMGG